MRILHVCAGNPFTESMYYKENYLIEANLEDGHEPVVLADTSLWREGRVAETDPGSFRMANGTRVIRVRFQNMLFPMLTRKLRKIPNFPALAASLEPDVILFHNIFQYGVAQLREIRERLPGCKIYGDVSSSADNSGRTFLSRWVLHGMIYRRWIQKSLPDWDKIFYVAEPSREFLRSVYDVPDSLLELNPLPARIMSREEKRRRGEAFRKAHGVPRGGPVLFHSGKMNALKRTVEMLRIVRSLETAYDFRLFIAGSFSGEIKEEAEGLMNGSDRIVYLGFLGQDELQTALAACDLYLQPGSASQTAQAAIACGAPVIVGSRGYYDAFVQENGYLIDDVSELSAILPELLARPDRLAEMSEQSYKVAERFFDYRKLAARLYQ